MKSVRFIVLLFFVLTHFAHAEYNSMGVPDSSQIRKDIAKTWLGNSLSVLRGKGSEVRSNSIGQKFQIWLEESKSSFSVIIAPESSLSFGNDGGIKTVSDFPADGCGSWLLERNSATGKPIRIRWYFVQDGDVFVQFSPDPYGGKKTLADYVIGGCYAARNVPVGISFERIYTSSFAEILALTEKTLPWRYSDIHTGQYSNKILMMKRIRSNLSRITKEKDAAYDEDGKPIYISTGKERETSFSEKQTLEEKNENSKAADGEKPPLTLDSNGFVKWIIDGLAYPITGSGMLIDPLLQPTVFPSPLGYAGVRSASENLNLSLDWTRNLAAARLSVQTKKRYLYESSGVDVRIEPFSAEISTKGIINVSGYMKNSGYNSKYLKPILYVLGVTEPTYFYLAAVRKSLRPGKNPEKGKGSEIFAFEDSAVIFPYFDKSGRFDCKVFFEGKELSLDSFLQKFDTDKNNCYIHLTRVLASDRFSLR